MISIFDSCNNLHVFESFSIFVACVSLLLKNTRLSLGEQERTKCSIKQLKNVKKTPFSAKTRIFKNRI